MTQTDLLFDAPPSLPYQPGSVTSRAAAESMKEAAVTQRQRVLAYLQQHGGHTDEEMQYALDMLGSTQRPRRLELQRAGLVVDSGAKRKTMSGRLATVWEYSGL